MAKIPKGQLGRNEVFVGNHCVRNTADKMEVPSYLRGLKTCRLGTAALDINGNKIDPSYCRPVIVNKSDYDEYNRIMQARATKSRRGY